MQPWQLIGKVREFAGSANGAFDGIVGLELGVCDASAGEQHCGVCPSGKASHGCPFLGLNVELVSPGPVIEKGSQIGRPFPQAQKSFGPIGFGAGVPVMIDGYCDKALARETMPEPFDGYRGRTASVRQENNREAHIWAPRGSIRYDRRSLEPGGVRRNARKRLCIRWIPNRPSERTRSGAIPVASRAVEADALSKSDLHESSILPEQPKVRSQCRDLHHGIADQPCLFGQPQAKFVLSVKTPEQVQT
jgi:hypothetical protein